MNMSRLISRMKKDLGLYGMAVPVENLDSMIADVVQTISLYTFSVLAPCRESIQIDLRDLEVIDKNMEYKEYVFRDKYDREIVSVEDVIPGNESGSGWGSYAPIYREELLYQNILANVRSQQSATMIPKITFKFLPPNRLRLYSVYFTQFVVVEYLLLHDPSLGSIPLTAEESFYKLAILDVKSTLYGMVKHYNEVQTAHGRIELKVDDWADAASRREELVSSWEDVAHLDRKSVYWG